MGLLRDCITSLINRFAALLLLLVSGHVTLDCSHYTLISRCEEWRCKLPIHQIKAILSCSVCLTTIHWFLMFHQTSQLTASVPLLVSSIQFAHIPLQKYKVCNPSGAGLQRADCNHRECLPANGAHQAQCCSVIVQRLRNKIGFQNSFP